MMTDKQRNEKRQQQKLQRWIEYRRFARLAPARLRAAAANGRIAFAAAFNRAATVVGLD